MMSRRQGVVDVVVAATLGLAVIVIPVALDPDARQYDAAFLPIVRTAVEGMKLWSLLFLSVIGFVVAWIGRSPIWVVGEATVAGLFVYSIIDMGLGGDHNLLPIEWLIYAILGLPGMFGAGMARGSRWLVTRFRRPPAFL